MAQQKVPSPPLSRTWFKEIIIESFCFQCYLQIPSPIVSPLSLHFGFRLGSVILRVVVNLENCANIKYVILDDHPVSGYTHNFITECVVFFSIFFRTLFSRPCGIEDQQRGYREILCILRVREEHTASEGLSEIKIFSVTFLLNGMAPVHNGPEHYKHYTQTTF